MRTIRPFLALAFAAVLLAGCGSESDRNGSDDPTAAAIVDTVEEGLTLVDGWAKATDEPMTGVFGTLTNTSEEDIHLTAVESDLAAVAELHVTVDDGAGGRVMQRADDGFVIPAGGEHALEPGGDHLMLMQLDAPVETGQDVELTLVTAAGQEYPVTVTARAFSGAEEHYAPGGSHDGAMTTTEAP